MTKNWKDVCPEIKRLYLTQGKPLEEVRVLIKDKYGFNASLRAYKNRIDRWGWKKYKKAPRSGAQIALQKFSQDHDRGMASSSSVASAQTRLRGLEAELEHQVALVRKEKYSLLSLRESSGRDTSDETNVERIDRCEDNLLRIERTLNSLEAILASVGVQINPPAGFASCWKQQPMMLEDAHGAFIPIPLDIVISWETFDNLLQSHFQSLRGIKKVVKREYAIEDSASSTKFSRDRPLSSFCKAGLKIDMSMIFNDKSKTSSECPRCNTISKEQKGMMVECKNPGCKMLFRTEEEEDQSISASRSRRRSRSNISTPSSPFLVALSLKGQEEDEPGLFKRVIMRIGKNMSVIADGKDRQPLKENLFSDWYQPLPIDVNIGFAQPSLGRPMGPISPVSSFPPGNLAPTSGTTILPLGQDQRVREGNLAKDSASWDFSSTFDQLDFSLIYDIFSGNGYASDAQSRLPDGTIAEGLEIDLFGRGIDGDYSSFLDGPTPAWFSPREVPVNSMTDPVITQSMGGVKIGEINLLDQILGDDPNSEGINTSQAGRSNDSPITIEEHYPPSLSPQNKAVGSERRRRESLAGSLVGGMSWGGVSVGSWIRDDLIMASTQQSDFQFSFSHSSSYLPKLEANFMKDFACCGKTLPTLHDLLQHYEEAHAQQNPQSLRKAS